jgi:cyclopropane fatty-acyl-phospholipid synthase-like methyltransferase
MNYLPDKDTYQSLYAGQPSWDIGRPQRAILEVAGQISGAVLDAGCGTGEHALYFAARGCQVTGIDFLGEPIDLARLKATQRNVTATFLVKDALTLADWTQRFDNVIDAGLFHSFNDVDRRRYVTGLATVLKPGGRLFLLCFSDKKPGRKGSRRVSKKELQDAFAEGWNIELIKASRFEARPDLNRITFGINGMSVSEDWSESWFMVANRAVPS